MGDAHPTMSRRILLSVIAILLVAFGMWWFSPAEQVKRRVLGLIDSAAVPSSMGTLSRVTRGEDVAKFFAPRLEIGSSDSLKNDVPNEIHRENAASLYTGVARYVREVSLVDPEITRLEISGDRAEVDFRVDAIVQLSSRRPIDGILLVQSHWIKHPEFGWVMDKVEWQETRR